MGTWWEAIGAEMEAENDRHRLIAERVAQVQMDRAMWQASRDVMVIKILVFAKIT